MLLSAFVRLGKLPGLAVRERTGLAAVAKVTASGESSPRDGNEERLLDKASEVADIGDVNSRKWTLSGDCLPRLANSEGLNSGPREVGTAARETAAGLLLVATKTSDGELPPPPPYDEGSVQRERRWDARASWRSGGAAAAQARRGALAASGAKAARMVSPAMTPSTRAMLGIAVSLLSSEGGYPP
mmetsp:Transcript_46269/g.116414  ORF Transcript_46269/g.116414 Transcript_46269/m.116414 type:complete len:186 (+) Transcript_46269:313-870(+)